MPRFLSLVRIEENTIDMESADPGFEQRMGALFEEITKAGAMVDTAGLRPTAEATRITWSDGSLSFTDGPFPRPRRSSAATRCSSARTWPRPSSGGSASWPSTRRTGRSAWRSARSRRCRRADPPCAVIRDVTVESTLETVFRMESARIIATVARIVRDVGIAEELAQDALVSALEQWPRSGIPEKRAPG
ncbi:hypothetical protein STANM309S_05718 [Streptomyces tanashiensis]